MVGMGFIVPTPMTKPLGVNKEGRPSTRCEDNTDPRRRFQVCEFDRGTKDEQAALLWFLARRMRLACVVDSAGKSLHGFFYVHDQTPEAIQRFFGTALALGADKAMGMIHQPARMPDGRRDTGARQTCHYFDPDYAGRQPPPHCP